MALTEAQSLQKYGTVAYTAWGEAEAQADWNAKHPTTLPTAQPAQSTQQGTQQQPALQQIPATAQASSVQDLINMGFYGYTGWSNAEALADYKATGGQGKGGPTTSGVGTSGATGFLSAPTINLPELYKGLYESSGISGIETDLSSKTKAYNEAVAKIKDNPYLSEATMTGRLSKLADKFNADTASIRSDIATKKADVETKLNIQMKQFDINSQQAQLAFNQFQTLLSSGALNNASGEDIANITRATGLSSSMINAAIKAQKDKNVQTSIIQWDDGTNQGFSVINSNTGEIIKTETVAASKPKAASAGDQKTADAQQTQQNAIADIQAGSTLRDIINHYAIAGGLSVEDVYRLYNSYSPYGAAKESIEEVKEGKFAA